MARGPKKHLKRMAAPSAWMLDKLSGVWAPKPTAGPHKQRECLPLTVLLRNRLKYALTFNEVKMILVQRLVKVDNKIRTDHTYPAGLMDVVSLDKTKEHFRLLYDTKGRFVPHRISEQESKYKLIRVRRVEKGSKGVTHCIGHDGRTIRFPHPNVKAYDTIKFNLETQQIDDCEENYLKMEHGMLCMIIGGNNIGRVGILQHREKIPGAFDICHLKDKVGHTFATRLANVFVIGHGDKKWISLPKEEGIKLSNIDDRKKRMGIAITPATGKKINFFF